jgi:hypothetical protein
MAKEIVTTKLGETVTVFTGRDAIEHILKITIGVMFLVIFPAIPCSSLWAPVTICLSTSPSFF